MHGINNIKNTIKNSLASWDVVYVLPKTSSYRIEKIRAKQNRRNVDIRCMNNTSEMRT
jgi:hypothetical protein